MEADHPSYLPGERHDHRSQPRASRVLLHSLYQGGHRSLGSVLGRSGAHRRIVVFRQAIGEPCRRRPGRLGSLGVCLSAGASLSRQTSTRTSSPWMTTGKVSTFSSAGREVTAPVATSNLEP